MKLPAFQFYPADWRKDPGVQSLSFHDRGVWFEILCLMHESEQRGKLLLNGGPMPDEALARLLGLDKQILTKALTILTSYGVASRCPETGTLVCRRMVRDENLRKMRQEVGKLGGNPLLVNQKSTKNKIGVNQKSTPSSSSSVSSSKIENSVCVKHSNLGEIPDDESDQTQNSFLEYFQKKHVAKLKRQTNLFDTAKILPKAQALMRTHGRETLFKIVDLFFEEDRSVGGQWLQNADYSFNVFFSQAERLAQNGKSGGLSSEEIAKRVEGIIAKRKGEANGNS